MQGRGRHAQTGFATAGFALAGALGLAAALAAACAEPAGPVPDTKVAFIGDQGHGPGARAVLELIRAEGADMVLHQGDFDYLDDPERFDGLITEVLGPDFPYFASLGNHDAKRWRGYQTRLRARLDRVQGAECEGDLAIMAACTYKGLFLVFSAVGLREFGPPEGHAAYIGDKLARARPRWRICSWHKTQRALQVGAKEDETGWGVYEACRKGGAIIATGHNHGYARTHPIARFADPPEVASPRPVSGAEPLEIDEGRTIAFVSGLGGRSVRPQKLGGEWWASIYTRTQNAGFGALFCTFAPGGRSERAECYFKTVSGEVPDRFALVRRLGR